jgi:hypothetical protein
MSSIVDPAEARGGAWTVTRGLIQVIQLAWPDSRIECISLASRSRAGHRYRQLVSVLASAIGGGLPAKISFARTTGLRRRLQSELEASMPDLIILNGSDLLWMLPDCPPEVPVVVVALNIEHQLYARQIAHMARMRPKFARVLERDCRKLREYEWAGMRRAGRVIFVSEEDRRTALSACPDIDSIVIPPVFDYEPAPRVASVSDRLAVGMFADFTWWPNRLSLEWFLREVWPSASADLELHLFGYGSERAARGVRRVTSHGSVDHPRDAFDRCDLMIAPIVDGAGVKVKVAEALYNRVPVAATSFALRGLPVQAIDSVWTCDSANEWIALLTNDVAREFARQPVPPAAAASFSPRRMAVPLARFLPMLGSRAPRSSSATSVTVTPVPDFLVCLEKFQFPH